MNLIISQSAWQPYELGNKPVVPEPAYYGAILLLCMLALAYLNKHNSKH